MNKMKYIFVRGKDDMNCMSACLEMILLNYGFIINQERIAQDIGAPYPILESKKGKDSKVNKFFRKNNISLNMEFMPSEEIINHEYDLLIKEALGKSKDVCVSLNEGDYNHVLLVEKYGCDENSDMLFLIDPEHGRISRELKDIGNKITGFFLFSTI